MWIIQTTIWILYTIFLIIFSILYLISFYNWIKNWVPLVSSFKSDFKVMKKWLKIYHLKWKKLIDLWSWIWKATRFFKREFQTKTYWVEIDLWSYLIAKTINYITKSEINLKRWNYLKSDISNYDYIYIYLFPEIIWKIEDKIWKETKKWTIVISNAFKFKKHDPIDILKDEKGKEEIYIYKV